MTRGKQGARAALKREDASVQSEIATYQRNVRDLKEHNKKLQTSITKLNSDYQKQCARLTAQIREGVSLELLETRKELDRQRERGDSAEARQREIQKKWDLVSTGLVNFLVTNFHYTTSDALIQVVRILGEDKTTLVPQNMPIRQASRLGSEGVSRISQARGEHRSGNAL